MWWNALTIIQKVYFCIACPATVLLVVQIILMLIGFGGGELDGDGIDVPTDGDVDITIDSDIGLSIFTLRGLTAFFTIGGWVGFTIGDGPIAVAIIVSLVCGTIALLIMAVILKWLIKLQSNGNLNLKSALGKTAEVYLTIPKKGQGEGKINIILNEKLVEMNAVQNGDEAIKTGAKVKIVDIIDNTYVVETL